MKKIFFSIVAIAALAACSKSEVAYEPTDEIGFSVVAGNITKSVVDGNVYPTELDMYVFAETTDNTDAEANYILNAPFTHRTEKVGTTDVWEGKNQSYYWPNVKKLHFAGYSDAGKANGSYDCQTGVLSITDYTPKKGAEAEKEGANDLMWFPSTKLTNSDGYGKLVNDFVPVYMYHTCAWITFIVKGDTVTSNKYTVTNLTMTGIDQTANVTCSATGDGADHEKIVPNIVWKANTDKTVADDATEEQKQAIEYVVPMSGNITLGATGKDVETNAAYDPAANAGGNVVVIPQVPGKLNLTYTYKSTTLDDIVEKVEGLDLALAIDPNSADSNNPTKGPAEWLPGKHYIYTITIKANEILIAPSVPVDWDDQNWNVTVE